MLSGVFAFWDVTLLRDHAEEAIHLVSSLAVFFDEVSDLVEVQTEVIEC